jgi:hypothetical protein
VEAGWLELAVQAEHVLDDPDHTQVFSVASL